MYWQNRKDRVSEYICVRASGASEWFFGVFNHFRVKKRSFFTINVKFKVILSSKSGGDVCTGHPPTQNSGGGGGDTSPHPPRDLRQWRVTINVLKCKKKKWTSQFLKIYCWHGWIEIACIHEYFAMNVPGVTADAWWCAQFCHWDVRCNFRLEVHKSVHVCMWRKICKKCVNIEIYWNFIARETSFHMIMWMHPISSYRRWCCCMQTRPGQRSTTSAQVWRHGRS